MPFTACVYDGRGADDHHEASERGNGREADGVRERERETKEEKIKASFHIFAFSLSLFDPIDCRCLCCCMLGQTHTRSQMRTNAGGRRYRLLLHIPRSVAHTDTDMMRSMHTQTERRGRDGVTGIPVIPGPPLLPPLLSIRPSPSPSLSPSLHRMMEALQRMPVTTDRTTASRDQGEQPWSCEKT